MPRAFEGDHLESRQPDRNDPLQNRSHPSMHRLHLVRRGPDREHLIAWWDYDANFR